jgi:sulfate permease, SulP family
MAPYARILVPLACSPLDRDLLRYAAMLGRPQGGITLDLVHVAAKPWGEMDRIWKEMETSVAEALQESGKETELSYHVLEGDVTDRLLEFAAQSRCDVILLGHQLAHSGRRALARRLAMKAPCSVWMVPEGSVISIRRIAAPVDFSNRSADSLQEAVMIASLAGLREVTALHVYLDKVSATMDEYDKLVRGREQEAFRNFLRHINLRGVEVIPEFVEAPTVAEALSRLDGGPVDLIVMGTRGRSRAASVLLGSETEQVIIESRVPVLAVKHFGARRSLLEVLLDRRSARPEREAVKEPLK